jgi:O-antigen ligase
MPLLLLMIVIMPYENSPYLFFGSSFLGVFQDFTVIKLLGLAGFAWAMLRMAGGDIPSGLRSPQARFFLLFFLGVVVSSLFSGSGFLAFSRYLAFLVFLPFVLMAVRTERDVKRVIYALVLSYTLVFPYAVRQMIRFDARLGTGLYESNYFAALLLVVIPLALVLARQASTRKQKFGWIVAAMVLVMSLLLTSSRGGLLGLLVAGMLFAYRRRGMIGVFALLGAIVIGLTVLPTDLGERALATVQGAAVTSSGGLEASNRAHTALFWAGLQMINDSPLTGVGPQNFKELSQRYSGLDQAYIGHNTYLEIAAEMGLPLICIFLMMIASVFGALKRVSRGGDRDDLAGWAEGLRYGLLGFLVAGAFISAQYEKLFWIVVFLSIAMERVARTESVARVPQSEDPFEPAWRAAPASEAS